MKRDTARAIILTEDEKEIYLLYRKKKENNKIITYYAIPGGMIEENETVEDAVKREIKEEFSVEIELLGYLGLNKTKQGIDYHYHAKIVSGIPKIGRKEKEKVLLGKLTPAQGKDTKKNELFLVEGNSAGGTAKSGRDKSFQAIMPLRGKVINACKASNNDLFTNEEINMIIHAIGAGVGSDCDPSRSNYNKIIIMSDADVDGSHIQTLLLTFFYKQMRPLIENGMIYIAVPPLYLVKYGKEKKYLMSNEELNEFRENYKGKFTIQRYKGLGEMNPDQLWETTMDPENRSLIRVNIGDTSLAEKRVNVLMGDKVEPRKEWINENVEFTLEDDYRS